MAFKASTDFDEERQRAYLWTAVLLWALIGLFLVLRDPVWRILHEGQLVAPISHAKKGWTELDKRLIQRLTSVEPEEQQGLDRLEELLMVELDRVRAGGAGPGAVTLQPLAVREELRAQARARARARLDLDPTDEIEAPELLYPETYFALAARDRLVQSVEIHQRLPQSTPLAEPGFAGELVSGWMNSTRFRKIVMEVRDLDIGIGAVASEEGGAEVDLLVQETFLLLDRPLAPIVDAAAKIDLAGRRLGEREVVLYLKGPNDPGFFPIESEWKGDRFRLDLAWDQGPGSYALRVGRGDRLSDPRPVLVE